MSEKEVIVSNVSKKHENPIAELVQVDARQAGYFVQTAGKYEAEIRVSIEEKRINAKSIMGIMAFNPSKGMKVNIITEGSDEVEARLAMEKFLLCE